MKELTQQEGERIMQLFDEIVVICGLTPITTIINELSNQLPLADKNTWELMTKEMSGTIGGAFSAASTELARVLNDPLKIQELKDKVEELKYGPKANIDDSSGV